MKGQAMDRESLAEAAQMPPTYRGTELPAPIRWGEPAPPRASLYQKTVIVAAALVGLALMVASVFESL
jgi:hypothetical protein